MNNRAAHGAVSLLAALAVASDPAPAAFATEIFEDVVEKTFSLNSAGTFSLRAIDGTVQLYGSNQNEVKVIATKRAFSLARLNGIQIEIEADGNDLKVNTIAPPKPAWGLGDRSGTVDYVINVPQFAKIVSVNLPNGELTIDGMRGTAVSATLGNGRATLRNCFCNQAVRVGTGGLDLVFDWSEDRPLAIDAEIRGGNAHAFIPADASFQLRASAPHGHIASDFSDMKNRRRGGVTELRETTSTAPASTLDLRATRGNIRISEVIW